MRSLFSKLEETADRHNRSEVRRRNNGFTCSLSHGDETPPNFLSSNSNLLRKWHYHSLAGHFILMVEAGHAQQAVTQPLRPLCSHYNLGYIKPKITAAYFPNSHSTLNSTTQYMYKNTSTIFFGNNNLNSYDLYSLL